MDSKIIKDAFAEQGIKVRVKKFYQGRRFRIVLTDDTQAHGEASQRIVAGLGLSNCLRRPGGDINQPHEMFTNVF